MASDERKKGKPPAAAPGAKPRPLDVDGWITGFPELPPPQSFEVPERWREAPHVEPDPDIVFEAVHEGSMVEGWRVELRDPNGTLVATAEFKGANSARLVVEEGLPAWELEVAAAILLSFGFELPQGD